MSFGTVNYLTTIVDVDYNLDTLYLYCCMRIGTLYVNMFGILYMSVFSILYVNMLGILYCYCTSSAMIMHAWVVI